MQKTHLKIMAEAQRFDGSGTFLVRIGSAFPNRDGSLNGFLEMLPLTALNAKGIKIHIRELDERDLERREAYRAAAANRSTEPPAKSANESSVPF